MANQTITQLPNAGPITGVELVPIVQDGVTVKTTTSALAGSPVMTQTFLTKNQEPTLNNSRYLATTLGLGLTDGGPNSSYTISLNATSGSLETASTGVIVKNAGATVVSRSLAASGAGLGVTNGDGVLGNPTFALTGIAQAVANLGGTGLMAIVGGTTVAGRQIYGTVNQINVLFGNGSDDPRLSLAPDVVLPGTGAMTVPIGTTAQEPPGVAGQFRFNSDTQTFDGFANGSWNSFPLSGNVTSFSAGLTGLTPSVPTGGAVVLAGTLNVASGGTGVNTLTGYVKGAGTTPLTASATIPTTDLSGTISNAQLANSAVTVNGTTISLGGSGVITATASNPLTIGTGLSGTSYNGSTPVTIAIDNTVATLTGTQTLTNKTISGLTNTLSNIPNSALTNSSVTIGTTGIALGASSLTLGGLTSVTVTQDPSAALDLATKQYVDAVAEGLHVHASCACATTGTLASITGGTVTYNNGAAGVGATLTLSVALTTLDGYTLQNGNRILVKNEATQANNGIYTWATGGTVLTRATDFDTSTEIASGDFTFISNGTLYANTGWVQTQPVTIVGTDPVSWQQFSGAGTYTAGTGLTLAGNQFSITNTGVSASTYGSASSVPVFAVNAQGQITSVTNTAIAINGSAVSGNISGQAGSVANALTAGTYLTSGGTYDGSVARTFAVDATSANIINKVVARDSSGNFSANIITADLNGNANTSTTATTATNLAGGSAGTIPYQSSAGITAQLAAGTSGQYLQSNGAAAPSWATLPAIGNGTLTMNVSGTGLSGSQTFTANQAGNATFTVTSNATSANTASTIVARDSSGNFSAGIITADLSGNATTATTATSVSGGTANVTTLTTSSTVTLNGGTANGIAYLDGSKVLTTGTALTYDGSTMVVNANTSANALRITQLGSGNALLVEDSTNPDASPFVIDQSGNVYKGYTSNISTPFPLGFQINGTAGDSGMSLTRWVASTASPTIYLAKSRGAAVATRGIVSNGDNLGDVTFTGDDGTNFVPAAQIIGMVDGTPGTNDMPGRLIFNTTADGAATPTERMRIDSAGRVGIGGTPSGGAGGERLLLALTSSITTSATSVYNQFNVSAASGSGNYTGLNTLVVPTATFAGTGVIVGTSSNVTNQTANTITDVRSFTAGYTTTGGGAVTNLYGFITANATLTSGTVTNHFGFYSGIASGTGRWNFYAAGSADNYFAGNILRGRTTASTLQASITPALQTHGTNSVSASSIGMVAWGTTQFPILQFARSNSGVAGTQTVVASGDTLGTVDFGGSDGTGFIRAAAITAQVDGTPGTNDMPGRLVFSTTADGASSVTERARITSTGAWSFGSTGTNTGTSGQVLTSQGSGAEPTWTTVGGGGGSVTVTNDTTTATDIYPLLATATSGTITAVNTSNANLLYTPSTGELKAEQMNAMNGIFVNAQTITVNYTVAATNNAMSAGPVTVASGISVTVSSGAVWTVV